MGLFRVVIYHDQIMKKIRIKNDDNTDKYG